MTSGWSERRVATREEMERLKANAPCLPRQRHTFAPMALVCLCGHLNRGTPPPFGYPEAVLFWSSDEPARFMPDNTPCWCVSEELPHAGWVHSPACLKRQLAEAT